MTIKLSKIEVTVKLPDLQRSMPVYKVRGVSFEERKQAILLFQEILNLGKVHPVDIQASLHLMSEFGEIQFYRPSGALWAQNAAVDDRYIDERRPWNAELVKDPEDFDNLKLVLNQQEQESLAVKTAELLEKAGLMSEQAHFTNVELDQVIRMDEQGKEIERFSGEGNVRFLYQLDGIPVDGAGAKSYVFYNPGEQAHELTGIYHAWREIEDAKTVQITGLEETLEKTITQDRELMLYYKKEWDIKLSNVDLVYFTIPPHKHQDYVFPALRVIGSAVSKDKELRHHGFEFTRFYNAAPPESYAKSELYADYLLRQL